MSVDDGRTSHRSIHGFGTVPSAGAPYDASSRTRNTRQHSRKEQYEPDLAYDTQHSNSSHDDGAPTPSDPMDMGSRMHIPVHYLTYSRAIMSCIFGLAVMVIVMMFQPVWMCAPDTQEVTLADAACIGVLASGFYFVMPLFLYH